MHDLKSDRNAYRVLQSISDYVNYFYQGERVYYLNEKGRKYVDSDVVRMKITTAQHYIMRNDLYIHLGQPKTWRNEIRISSGEGRHEIKVVADAHIVENNKHTVIEIDHTQSMSKNRVKVRKYRDLIQRGTFKQLPKMIWVTTSEYRRELLYELCEGLDVKVYLPFDIQH